jgi:hypothetical protein
LQPCHRLIDEVKIFSRALSAAEIAAEYSATNQSPASWHRRYFGANATKRYADDDGDRNARLVEYALGSEPVGSNNSAVAFPCGHSALVLGRLRC